MYSFHKYVMGTFSVPATVLWPETVALNKIKISALVELKSLCEGIDYEEMYACVIYQLCVLKNKEK